VAAVTIWTQVGYVTLFFVAGLTSIPVHLLEAARIDGANAWQTFWRITLPGIKWAVVYGVVLSLARSLGEFGAVKVVAGNVSGETTTAPVLVQQKYQNFEQQTAYAMSFILVAVAVVCLVVVALLRPKDHKTPSATAVAATQEK
jgi:sulfate transport system permease protein